MDDVEFVGAGPDAGGDDDVLTVGPRRKVPRWAVVAGAVLVVSAASATFVVKANHSAGPATQPFRPAPPPSNAAPTAPSVDPTLLGPGTLAVAIAGNQLYALAPDSLTSFDLATMRLSASVPFKPVLSHAYQRFRLAYDAVQASIWVIPVGGRSAGTLMEFGAADLRPMRGIRLPTTVTSAAVLDGEIYLGTASRGLLAVPRGWRSAVTVLATPDGIGPMVADPDRRRLLYLTDGPLTLVRSWSARHGPGPAVGRLDFDKADLVVVSGSIWAAGFRAHGAALVHIDPDSLQPAQSDARLAAQLGPGAIIAAAGDRDFFVRSATGEPLWCVDGRTGAVDQRWDGPAGPVAAGPGQVWVAGPTGDGSLLLRGCVG